LQRAPRHRKCAALCSREAGSVAGTRGPALESALARKIKTLQDVVDWGLCIGCGACYYASPEGAVSLVNIESVGIRPRFESAASRSCTDGLRYCPGAHVDGELATGRLPMDDRPSQEFGPSLEIWEGYAADPDIRFRASSGGILSALELYCLERENMAFILHSAMNPQKPWENRTVQSRTRAEIMSRTGSRYGTSSPCEGLGAVEQSDRPCVFVGKPCDSASVMSLRRDRKKLDENLGLVLTFFCAGTPSTKGTLELIKSLDVPLKKITEVRYRGEGWPGEFKVRTPNGAGERSMSYEKSWGQLSGFRPLRCHICPDGTGQVADISCGDAWQSLDTGSDPGRSLVVVRTERGREILHRAIVAGYVSLQPATASAVLAAQTSLLHRRKELFGRFFAFKLFLRPMPRFTGFALFRNWARLPFLLKMRTILGTMKRVLMRGLWHRHEIVGLRVPD
jgi:coenzyme F420 hydrogenase subunit beta